MTLLSVLQSAQRRLRTTLRAKAHEALVGFRWTFRARKRAHSLPGQLVVSLTSYPPRFHSLHLTLKCLATQSVAPDEIVLWIAADDVNALPAGVRGMAARGMIEIRTCADLKSYKKIIPLLETGSKAFVVTADDDVYYPRNWLKELVESFDGDTKVVLCHRAHEISLNKNGLPQPYDRWRFDVAPGKPSALVFPTGVGGVLYPPGVFHSDVTARDVFQQLCPNADDVWLYWMARRHGAKFRKVGKKRSFVDWAGTQAHALWIQNVSRGSNDVRINAMIHRFGFPQKGAGR